MTDETNPADLKSRSSGKGEPKANLNRRRFTKAGAVAPFVMTLGSRPVWGACTASLSGEQSGNTSHVTEAPGTTGYPPSWWATSADQWPPGMGLAAPDPTSLQGSLIIRQSGSNANLANSSRIFQVTTDRLCISTQPIYALIRSGDGAANAEIAAAFLNAAKNPTGFGYDAGDLSSYVCNSGSISGYADVLYCLNRRPQGASTGRTLLTDVTMTLNGNSQILLGAYWQDSSTLVVIWKP